MGGRVEGYCSDFTRTICSGEPDDTYKKVYNIVLGAQLAAEEGCHEELAEALRLQGFALSALGHPEEAQGLLTTARKLARDSGKPA